MLAALLLNYPLKGKRYPVRRYCEQEEIEEQIEALEREIIEKPQRKLTLIKNIKQLKKRIDTIDEEASVLCIDDQLRRRVTMLYLKIKGI